MFPACSALLHRHVHTNYMQKLHTKNLINICYKKGGAKLPQVRVSLHQYSLSTSHGMVCNCIYGVVTFLLNCWIIQRREWIKERKRERERERERVRERERE